MNSHPRFLLSATLHAVPPSQPPSHSGNKDRIKDTYKPPTRGPNEGPKKTHPPNRLVAYPRPVAFHTSAMIPTKSNKQINSTRKGRTRREGYSTSTDNKRRRSERSRKEPQYQDCLDVRCKSLSEEKNRIHAHRQPQDISSSKDFTSRTPENRLKEEEHST